MPLCSVRSLATMRATENLAIVRGTAIQTVTTGVLCSLHRHCFADSLVGMFQCCHRSRVASYPWPVSFGSGPHEIRQCSCCGLLNPGGSDANSTIIPSRFMLQPSD